jgi:hypothetical protein
MITFQLSAAGKVRISIYDVLGREVAELVNVNMLAGKHSVEWKSATECSGVYYCRMTADDYSETKKILLLR